MTLSLVQNYFFVVFASRKYTYTKITLTCPYQKFSGVFLDISFDEFFKQLSASIHISCFKRRQNVKKIYPLIDYPIDFVKIAQLTASSVSSFVSFKGIVTRTSNCHPCVYEIEYECNKCLTSFLLNHEHTKEFPKKCPNTSCISRSFRPISNSIKNQYKNTQIIRYKIQNLEFKIQFILIIPARKRRCNKLIAKFLTLLSTV